MAEGIVFSILGKIGEYLVAPIGRQFNYLFCYNNNIENLKDQAKNLEDIKDGVQLSVAAARNNLEVVAPQVQSWLANVEKMKMESDRIFQEKALVDKGCLNGWCLNPKSRYLLSKKASKKAQVIVELRSEGKPFARFSYPAPPIGTVASTSTSGSKDSQTRMSIAKEIRDALENHNIGMIGVCGMGGVGKTTMVQEIAKRAISEKNFDEFAIAVVSQNKDVIKIQRQLAEMLGLKFEEQDNIYARAERLRQRLMNGKRILVILDDVWEALDLKEIGIPIGDDRKGCKVALTSRNEHICSSLGAQKNFKLEVLTTDEAWEIFKKTAGNCVDAADVSRIAEDVAKECGGLPLALITVANALRNKSLHTWNDALQQLRRSTVKNITGMHKEVYSRIELSYNYLESDQAKSLLLLCCLFQEDEEISIELLVRYGVGLELFEDLETLAETRNRVCSLVDELRSSCLLLGEGQYVYVKMHDIVRDVGLSIASKDGHGYMVRHDTSLKEWPQKDKHSPHTAISLCSNEMFELPAGLECPNLKLLRLVCRHPNLEIARDFFVGMKELKVMAYSVDSINSLPPSIRALTNLRTLCLEDCDLVVDISLIEGLQKLEILSLFNSHRVEFSSEIGKLSNLKLLDLRHHISSTFTTVSNLNGSIKIPGGVLSQLKKLEELYMGVYFMLGDDNGVGVTELNSLYHLNRLQMVIPDGNEFLLKLKDFHFQKLMKFNIAMQSQLDFVRSSKYQFGENSLSLSCVDKGVIIKSNINVLLRRTENLKLVSVRHLKNVVGDLDGKGFVNLKKLELSKCDELECVIYAEIPHARAQVKSFEILQEMKLSQLPKMTHLWGGLIQPPSFGNLRVLRLFECAAIKGLVTTSGLKCLRQLEKLEICNCEMMEAMVLVKGDEGNTEIRDQIVFPELNDLRLRFLRKFRCIIYSGETDDNLGSISTDDITTTHTLFTQQVLMPNLKTLEVDSLEVLHVLIAGHQLQGGSLYNLQNLSVMSCHSLKVIFDCERLKVGKEYKEVMLGQLEEVKLYHLSMLTHIWRMVPKGIQGFHNLKTLSVDNCDELRYLLSTSMAKVVVNLQVLELIDCKMIEEVIKEEEEEDISGIKMMDKIVFPQLRVLKLRELGNIRMFCSRENAFEFPRLQEVLVDRCPNMKTFCPGQLTAPMLDRVYISQSNKLWFWKSHGEWVWKGDLNNTIASLNESPQRQRYRERHSGFERKDTLDRKGQSLFLADLADLQK